MLADLKAKTPCKDCGRKGHWRGDKECTMQRRQPYERRAHVATRFCDAYSTSRCTSELDEASQFFNVGDEEKNADKCGDMSVYDDTESSQCETWSDTQNASSRQAEVTDPCAYMAVKYVQPRPIKGSKME